MIATDSPLTERLVLFWHDHFATSFDGTENSQWMADQNRLLRDHAAGNFADLANRDPARPGDAELPHQPRQHARGAERKPRREFLELFTLGEGRGYTEADIAEAARALTGHTVAELTAPTFRLDEEAHDPRPQDDLRRKTGASTAWTWPVS